MALRAMRALTPASRQRDLEDERFLPDEPTTGATRLLACTWAMDGMERFAQAHQ